VTPTVQQLFAASAFIGSLLAACAAGLVAHLIALGWEWVFGERESELAGDHEEGWR
jgi:hypothetical protein